MRDYKAPMFQHRHYAAIAKLLADTSWDASPAEIRAAFANLFVRDNGRFDWDRFMAAANGVPSNGRDKR